RVLLHDRHGARGPPELGYRPGRPWTLGAPFGAAVLRGPSALRPVGTHRCAVRTAERRRPGDGARQARPFGAVEVAAAGRGRQPDIGLALRRRRRAGGGLAPEEELAERRGRGHHATTALADPGVDDRTAERVRDVEP